MGAIIQTSGDGIIPKPRVEIAIRQATLADAPFMDRLQKTHSKQLGYFPTKQFEGYVEMGAVLVAVGARPASRGGEAASDSTLRVDRDAGVAATEEKLGYIISRDRYLKRDELGVVYQLCVAPGEQRKLVGASLVAEVFRCSAYGCKLYCCWCAQDIDANYFWESLGFVPIAFRAGSAKKKRVHIFWQRRVHADDTGEKATPWWYPCATNGGAIREDRLVFPIPPGVHWKDVTGVVRAERSGLEVHGSVGENAIVRARKPKAARREPKSQNAQHETKPPRQQISTGRLFFGSPVVKAKNVQAPKGRVKNDPALAAKARELRDRWMEELNRNPAMLLGNGKYEVGRADLTKTLSGGATNGPDVLALPAAA